MAKETGTELVEEQKELVEKLKILDKDVRFIWKEGLVTLIDGIIPIPIAKDTDTSVRNFLMEYSALFGFKKDLSDMRFINKTYGVDTHHMNYQQYYNEIPVFHTFTSVHLNKLSQVIVIKNHYHPDIQLDTEAIIMGGIPKEKAIEIVQEYLNAETRLKKDSTADLKILPEKGEYYLTWEVFISLKNPLESYHIYVDVRDGEILRKVNILKGKTTGKGRVFIPNPVVALKDTNISPEAVPEEAYTSVVLKGLDGSGFLRGEYVDTADTPTRTYEPSLLFYFFRGDSRFCEVMVYYHIDSCQRFIQELGFKNICNRQIKVNAFAEGEGSFFDHNDKTITYGATGIPDAEDADIIIHEYCHAMIDDQVPFLSLNEQGCAIEQGLCDFFAACYFSEENDGFNRECVGDWNGIGNVLKCIRRVDNPKYYPEDFKGVMTCDADGEIWSAALWDLYLTLGGNSKEKDNRIKARDRTMRLALESTFYLTPLSDFMECADAIIMANKHLYKGKDDEKIRDVLISRGFF